MKVPQEILDKNLIIFFSLRDFYDLAPLKLLVKGSDVRLKGALRNPNMEGSDARKIKSILKMGKAWPVQMVYDSLVISHFI